MRKHYIDNLRLCTVLLLFPFHTFMIYNNWGENFYVRQASMTFPSFFNGIIWPWFMPLLFLLSGIGAYHALEKRSTVQFIKERFLRLFVPLVTGILIIIPVQTYFAEKFHNGYDGSYFAQYSLFFTKVSDLTGYTGGFTPGHLWFILFLFIISLITLPVIYLIKERNYPFSSISFLLLLIIGIIPLFGKPIASIGGKSIVEYSLWYLLGYIFFSKDAIIDVLTEKRRLIYSVSTVLFLLFAIINSDIFSLPDIFTYIASQCYAWFFILSMLVLFKQKMNSTNKTLQYFSDSSFPVYILHQSVLVFCAYYIVKIPVDPIIHIIFILISSIILTFGFYELISRIPVISVILLGIKKIRRIHDSDN
ncbi:MAG TPA: acyltransferase [Treponemataceae bacterium]|nr:acyltransferase [Treponemataceae bacterium]